MTQQLRTLVFVFAAAISLCLPSTAATQKNTLTLEEDTVPLLRGISVSYDVAGTIMRMVSDYGQYEAALRVNLKDKYFPVLELGLGDAKHNTDPVTGLSCKTNAPYGRIGCDMNVAKNKHDDYKVFIGARYAFTSFKQEACGTVSDSYWGGTTTYDASMPSSCNYHWTELLFGVDAKVYGPLHLGWSFRYKVKIHSTDTGSNKLWYVPGYGKDGNVLGGTFNVTIQLGK